MEGTRLPAPAAFKYQLPRPQLATVHNYSHRRGRRCLVSLAQLKDDVGANKAATEPSATGPTIRRRAALLAAAPCLCAACLGGRAAKAAGRNPLYDKYFAAAMRYAMDDYEAIVRPVKSQMFGELVSELLDRKPGPASADDGGRDGLGARNPVSSDAPKRVLEVGIGTGPNFPFYTAALSKAAGQVSESRSASASASGSGFGSLPADSGLASAAVARPQPQLHIVGLDPNPEMLGFAEVAANDAGFAVAAAGGSGSGGAGASAAAPALAEVSLVQGSAQALPFSDGEFDAAVVTLVMCSVPDPGAALAEIRRVVRPGGLFLIIEHVAAGPERPVLRFAQAALTPLQRCLADGCCLNRDTAQAVRAAGWEGELRSFDLEGLTLLAPHIAGLLVR